MPRLCPLCPSDDGIDVSHNQARTAIANLAGFECELLHIADLFSSPPCPFLGQRRAGRDAIPDRKTAAPYAARRKPDVLGLACSRLLRNNDWWTGKGRARAMSKSDDAGFDFDRYRRLLAEADDEPKRLAFINLLVDEKAKDKLAGQALRGRLAELGLQAKK
jgi:hypothetical protein